ncbi:MAG: T9SS type A sorting domain-containing protein [Bacteroidetes bacterium]|nr:MAG: T9SS type A sorting domain-containing protein [Bacteroidota bacterium]
MKKSFTTLFAIVIIITFLCPDTSSPKNGKSGKKTESTLRAPVGFCDNQKNTVSNVEFYSSNFGIVGNNILTNSGGTFWPRGSVNQYIYAGGFWFGGKKYLPGEVIPNKLVEISYNPNSGGSWFVPGRIDDGESLDTTDTSTYRNYFSTDFRKFSGVPYYITDGPNWPLWIEPDDLLSKGLYLGTYESDISKRNRDNYLFGPAYISDEDIFSTYKDTDLDRFDGGREIRELLGYPLKLQVEQRIFTWANDLLKDVVIIYYNIINFSQDTLYDCWFAPVYDFDIGKIPAVNAQDDHSQLYKDDRTLNMVICWDDTLDLGNRVNGIMGFSYLMTPAVDNDYFLRKDKKVYLPSEQLGLKSYKNWRIEEDGFEDEQNYARISSNKVDTTEEKGDMRLLFSTGPFNMLPGDTLKVALSILFAIPDSVIGIQKFTTTKPDFTKLVNLARYTQNFFYNNLILGINDENHSPENHYLLYPNPASDIINILSNNSLNIDKIELYNLIGEKIIEKSDIYSQQYKLNTRSFQNGTYYLRIKSGINTETKLLQIAK